MSKDFDKNVWRREVAGKCLVALYGSTVDWESNEAVSKAILLSVDALDKALEEAEKASREKLQNIIQGKPNKCIQCGNPSPVGDVYCSTACYLASF